MMRLVAVAAAGAQPWVGFPRAGCGVGPCDGCGRGCWGGMRDARRGVGCERGSIEDKQQTRMGID